MGFAAAQGGPSGLAVLILAGGAWSHGINLSVFTPGLPATAALLYASGVFWTLGYDTIYAVQDLEDDALAGVKSSARKLGANAPNAVLSFYVIAFALALGVWWTGRLGPLFLPVAAVFGAHLARQPTRLRLDDPAGALAIFNSNTVAGLLLVLALVAGAWRAGW